MVITAQLPGKGFRYLCIDCTRKILLFNIFISTAFHLELHSHYGKVQLRSGYTDKRCEKIFLKLLCAVLILKWDASNYEIIIKMTGVSCSFSFYLIWQHDSCKMSLIINYMQQSGDSCYDNENSFRLF